FLSYLFFLITRPPPPTSTLFPYTTLFRSLQMKSHQLLTGSTIWIILLSVQQSTILTMTYLGDFLSVMITVSVQMRLEQAPTIIHYCQPHQIMKTMTCLHRLFLSLHLVLTTRKRIINLKSTLELMTRTTIPTLV